MNPYIKIIVVTYLGMFLLACSSTTSVVSNKKPSSRYSAEFDGAIVAMRSGDIESAKNALEALTKSAPNYTGPWTNLGIIYAGQRDYAAAEKYFNEALKRQARNTTAMNWLGYLSSIKQDYQSASNWYLRAISIAPEYSEAHLNLAILYDANMRRPKDALEHYRIYQSQTGGENALVGAWIRNLEESIDYVASNREVE